MPRINAPSNGATGSVSNTLCMNGTWVKASRAVDGGIFAGSHAVSDGVEKIVPVDLDIRGCAQSYRAAQGPPCAPRTRDPAVGRARAPDLAEANSNTGQIQRGLHCN